MNLCDIVRSHDLMGATKDIKIYFLCTIQGSQSQEKIPNIKHKIVDVKENVQYNFLQHSKIFSK